MAVGHRWIDLLDPSKEQLHGCLTGDIHERALEQLLAPAQHEDEPRPKLESHGDYVLGIFLVAVILREEDLVYYQEVDVVLTRDRLVTIRKTAEGGRPPFDPATARASCRAHESVGLILYHLADDVAERYL